MSWRPEGWETVDIASRMWQGKPLRSTHDAFEAGADAMLEKVCEGIEKVENKPTQYHYVCWASGMVKIRDEWGAEETYLCHSYDGDFNCGCRSCTSGIIKGHLELTDIERHENQMLQKILALLRSK